jgi:hypothetical protein
VALGRPGKTVLTAAVSLTLLCVTAAIYLGIGWYTMEDECAGASDRHRGDVYFSYTIMPGLGFTCTYEDGSSRTALWF